MNWMKRKCLKVNPWRQYLGIELYDQPVYSIERGMMFSETLINMILIVKFSSR